MTEVTTARLRAELTRVQHERDRAIAARDKERVHVASLQELVSFLQEQLRSAQDYEQASVNTDVMSLLAEREALLQEIAVLNEELLVRTEGDARLPIARHPSGHECSTT